MKQSSLFKIAGIAGALIVAALVMKNRDPMNSAHEALSNDALLIPALEKDLNKVTSIEVSGAGPTLIVRLNKTDSGWVTENLNNYPADVNKIREYLLKLSLAKLREAKTANPESYSKLGVEDIKAEGAKGALLELKGLDKPVRWIMGSFASTGGEGVYVRDPEQKQSYLASGAIRPEASQNAWIQADLTSIGSSRIQKVSITAPDGSVTAVAKEKPEDSDWAVLNPPKGKELAGPSVGNVLVGTLDQLRLETVQPAGDTQIDSKTLYDAVYDTFDGITVNIKAWQIEGKDVMRLSSSFNETIAKGFVELEAAKAKATADAETAADKSKANTFNADKFKADKLAELKAEAEAINKRASGWNYTLPPYQFGNIKKQMSDLLMPPPSAAPAAPPGNPLNLPIGQ